MSIPNSTPLNIAAKARGAKHIKIDADHGNKLSTALFKVNGNATTHAFTRPWELEGLAERAERQLEALGIAKGRRAGAFVVAVSGGTVANAYKFSRKLTKVRIERKSAGWYLTSTEQLSGYRGSYVLNLTPAQDAEAVETLRFKYECARPTHAEQLASA